jgi:hypothetical protein
MQTCAEAEEALGHIHGRKSSVALQPLARSAFGRRAVRHRSYQCAASEALASIGTAMSLAIGVFCRKLVTVN